MNDPLEVLHARAAEVFAWENVLTARAAELAVEAASGESCDLEGIRAELFILERALNRIALTLAALARLVISRKLEEYGMGDTTEGAWLAAYRVVKCPAGHTYLEHKFDECPWCEMKMIFGVDNLDDTIKMLRRRLTPEQRRELIAHLSYDVN